MYYGLREIKKKSKNHKREVLIAEGKIIYIFTDILLEKGKCTNI